MNGIYWDHDIPRLFEKEDINKPDFKIQTIADITDDQYGSVPCNLGDSTIDDPVYGVDKMTFEKTAPYLPNSIDVMAVGNLPNELPRDASRYFGQQMIKFILKDIIDGNSEIIDKATIVKNGVLTAHFAYMKEYAGEEVW
jgi:alanine dehydrogenase